MMRRPTEPLPGAESPWVGPGTREPIAVILSLHGKSAKVAELADALDLGSSGATLEGSSPSFRISRS
jgi:hypothetical protein